MLTVNQIGHGFGPAAPAAGPKSACGSQAQTRRRMGEDRNEYGNGQGNEYANGQERRLEEEMDLGALGTMIRELRRVLGPNKGLALEDIDVAEVQRVMEQYQSNEKEWGRFAMHDGSRSYSRNGVVDINGNANLLILVWTPERASAIHDHANAHCCMKILKGRLQESLYDMPDHEGCRLTPRQETVLTRDEVGYISDDIGLHKISNPATDQVAVSLHLYTPPYASMYGCSMYEAGSGRKHHVDMSKYYSWEGKLVNPTRSSSC